MVLWRITCDGTVCVTRSSCFVLISSFVLRAFPGPCDCIAPENLYVSLQLKNPHSVLAVLETRPQMVVDVRLSANKPPAGAWEDVARLAAAHRIPIVRGSDSHDGGGGRRHPKHQTQESGRTGVAQATVKEREDVSLEQLFAGTSAKDGRYGLWLALDQIQDPHNVGAIFRSASFFGVRGIVHTRDRSAPLNSTVYDVASGGIEYVPYSSQPNLSRALEQAKKAGLWVLGASEHAEVDVCRVERDRPWLLVLGNEEKGLRRLTLENCDVHCRLTPHGTVGSLNVSVAAGVLMALLTGHR